MLETRKKWEASCIRVGGWLRHRPGDVGLTARATDAGVYTDRRKRPLGAVSGHLCTLLCRGLGCGWPWDRNSVHKWEDRASPRRFGAFVYTVATRVAIRIASRAVSGGTSASATMACRLHPLAGPSRLVGKTDSERVAPLPGWRLRRGVKPHKPPKSPISCSVLDGKMLLIGSPA